MRFIPGECYTRDHIHEQLGGEKTSYLPQKDGRVVYGCFSSDANPEAPYEILIGGEDYRSPIQRKVKVLEKQQEAFAVFLERVSNDWTFEGNFRLKRISRDRKYLDEKQRNAGRTDVVLALILEQVEVLHDTYLLTWNPRNWPWDNLDEMVKATAQGKLETDYWSCGNTKRIRPGDRLFLLRQGAEPRGIMAAGWATSATYDGPHWDERRQEEGVTSLRVELKFERILNPDVDEILALEKLREGALSEVNWATPASGIQIRRGAEDLERLWGELLRFYPPAAGDDKEASALEGGVRLALRRHRAREAWIRDAKIAQFKKANKGRLPCQVCGFDFFETYGELGLDYAQVHHLNPLGDRTRPRQTKLSELAIVCANCHVMIHRGGQILPLEAILSSHTS